jgi:hypothetical protein
MGGPVGPRIRQVTPPCERCLFWCSWYEVSAAGGAAALASVRREVGMQGPRRHAGRLIADLLFRQPDQKERADFPPAAAGGGSYALFTSPPSIR